MADAFENHEEHEEQEAYRDGMCHPRLLNPGHTLTVSPGYQDGQQDDFDNGGGDFDGGDW